MTKMRWGPPSLAAALAVAGTLALGAVVPTYALAHSYSVEGTELKATETAEVIGLGDKIEVVLASTKVAFTCRENASPGKLETSGKSVEKLNFSDCALDEITSKGVESLLTTCTVTEPIEFKDKGELVGTKGPPEVELKPETGTVFTTLELAGASCTLKGKYEVLGSQICALPAVDVSAEEHELACDEFGSKLEVGTKEGKKEPAKMFANDTVVLGSRKSWSAN